EVRRRLVFTQWHELNEAVESGRGVLIVTMHFGVWDLGAGALAAHDYPINVIVDTFRDAKLDRLVHSSREKLGMKVIPRERVGIGVFRALRRGEILAMLIDVPPEDQVVTVDFFGRPAQFSAAPARIALRTGAWVVPAMVLRGPEEDQLIRPIIDVRSVRYEPTGDEEHDVHALTQQIAGALEAALRRHPEQWYLFHPLWAHGDASVTRALLTSER
ncbi:MAG: lysophospholipid acyltransferase family protein, partial [Dehalococcoidia bacterium]